MLQLTTALLLALAPKPSEAEPREPAPRLAELGKSCQTQRGISAAAFRKFLLAPKRQRAGWTVVVAGSTTDDRQVQASRIAAAAAGKLQRIALDEVMTKYIGETEKNLDRLLQTAAKNDVVLFFDEADALFGKRTQVSDAHDKYANQEVSYLLETVRAHPDLVLFGIATPEVELDTTSWVDTIVTASPKDRDAPLPWHRLCWPPRA